MERLQKIIAASGLMSRRAAEKALMEGRVSLNGNMVTEPGTKANPAVDVICVDDKPLPVKSAPQVRLFYKPKGVLTTKKDPQGRPTVMDFFSKDCDLNPVGRLDFDSEGLLVFTNIGDLAHVLTHPRFEIPKTYHVWLDKAPAAHDLAQLKKGVDLQDGPGRFVAVQCRPKVAYVVVTVSEGRNRFVRRMWNTLGYTVLRLKRVDMGPFALGTLKPGTSVTLSADELGAVLDELPPFPGAFELRKDVRE